MAEAIGGMRAVTIASIRGHCIGGGVVLASACDLRVASTTARFRIPEVDLGIPLYWTGIPRLVREIGPALTKELVMTGRSFDAHEATAMRFVNRVVADDALEVEVAALADELESKRGHVLRVTKEQVEAVEAAVPDTDAGVEADVDAFALALGGDDDGVGAVPPFTEASD